MENLTFLLLNTFRLQEINFGDCLLKTRGAVIIAEAIQDGHLALETLILEANEIGPNGGCAIASAMCNKSLLSLLSLNCNQVSMTLVDLILLLYPNRRLICVFYP